MIYAVQAQKEMHTGTQSGIRGCAAAGVKTVYLFPDEVFSNSLDDCETGSGRLAALGDSTVAWPVPDETWAGG